MFFHFSFKTFCFFFFFSLSIRSMGPNGFKHIVLVWHSQKKNESEQRCAVTVIFSYLMCVVEENEKIMRWFKHTLQPLHWWILYVMMAAMTSTFYANKISRIFVFISHFFFLLSFFYIYYYIVLSLSLSGCWLCCVGLEWCLVLLTLLRSFTAHFWLVLLSSLSISLLHQFFFFSCLLI